MNQMMYWPGVKLLYTGIEFCFSRIPFTCLDVVLLFQVVYVCVCVCVCVYKMKIKSYRSRNRASLDVYFCN
jgi:hypothetical protein